MFKSINNWWESLCNGCGICCYEKEFDDQGLIYINLDRPCTYLEVCSNRCSIYSNRFKVNRECKKVNLFTALFNPYLPGHCGYVKRLRFWKRSKGV